MAISDYDNLTKLQKLTIFLIVMGPESSAEILKQFEDSEIEAICREMTNFTSIDRSTQTQVIHEFSEIILESLGSLSGGAAFARKALELAKGDFKADRVLEKISPGGHSADSIKEIGHLEPEHIFNLIKTESPQTMSFILSYLDADKAAMVVPLLPMEVRDEVIERLGTLNSTSLELVDKVAKFLTKNIEKKKSYTMHVSGGVRTAADILNIMDKEDGKLILAKIEERNPELGNAIRKKMFGFNDLVRLGQQDLQRIMREVDTNDLVISLKTANAMLRDSIYGAISKRAAETLKEELEMLGPVRLKDVEAAQDRIIQVVRRLEEQEEISIDRGGAGVVA